MEYAVLQEHGHEHARVRWVRRSDALHRTHGTGIPSCSPGSRDQALLRVHLEHRIEAE